MDLLISAWNHLRTLGQNNSNLIGSRFDIRHEMKPANSDPSLRITWGVSRITINLFSKGKNFL